MKKVELPDFDDMMELAKKIGNEKTQIMLAESKLELMLAQLTDTVTKSKQYWVGDKPPSNAHISDTYHQLGINDETRMMLWELRSEIANLTGELKEDEALFKVYQEMINVWRTQSANERGAYLE